MRIEVKGDRESTKVLTGDSASLYPTDNCFYEESEEFKYPKTNITFTIYDDQESQLAKAIAYLESGKADITIKGMEFSESANINYKRELFSMVCDAAFDQELMKTPILVMHVVCTKESGIPSKVAEQLGFVGPILHGSPVLRLLNPEYSILVETLGYDSKSKTQLDQLRLGHQAIVERRRVEIERLLEFATEVGGNEYLIENYELILENLDPHDNETKQGTK